MATTLIKIDRESIRRNPKAGETTTMVAGRQSVSFELKGGLPLPSTWLDKVTVTEQQFTSLPGEHATIKGFLLNPEESGDFLDEVGKLGTLTMHHDLQWQTIHHQPQPGHLYSYDNTAVECSSCHSWVIWKTIEEEESSDRDTLIEICPVCGEEDTFDYELENIEDVTKELNKS